METNANDWKSGTEALSLCMICGGEYEPGTRECPDCHVSLSMVRRCPACHRIVSAKHTKCVHCRTSFTHELATDALSTGQPAVGGPLTRSKGVRRFRAAAVSIGTFLFVFCLGLAFLRQVNQPGASVPVIAKSIVLQSAQLRRTPSSSSSVVGQIAPGTAVNITGFKESDEGRWMALDWNKSVVYLPTEVLAAPKATAADEGANALKFYLLGMVTTESVDEAIKAVDYYVKVFPSNAHGEELRWVLAERVRVLSQQGGTESATLRREANLQYQQLVDLNGQYADKARDALKGIETIPSRKEPRVRQHAASTHKPKADQIQIISGSGTKVITAPPVPH
ncbi:MAG: hypothetical protein WA532_12760 [Candidatus Korobacteraceae bacterium]